MDEAGRLYKRAEYKSSAVLYEQQIQSNPGDALAHQGLAQCSFKLEDWHRAWTEARRAVELDAGLPVAHLIVANISASRGYLTQAEAEAKRAIQLEPTMWQAYLNLGNILKAQGKLEEALSAYKKATDLDPMSWEAHLGLSFELQAQRLYSDSLKEATRAFRLHPTFQTAYLLLIIFQKPRSLWIALGFTVLFLGAIWMPSVLSYPIRLALVAWLLFLEVGRMKYGRKNLGATVLIVLMVICIFYLLFRLPP